MQMTQTILGVAVLVGKKQEEPKCNPKNTKTKNWKAVLDGIKGCEGSPSDLKNNMDKKSIPNYPSQLEKGWNLFECSQNTFPTQTHHLIPEKMVPKHPVSTMLTDSPNGDAKNGAKELASKNNKEYKEYKLKGDTTYDTNGKRNGYFMPFAATTHQWHAKPAKQMKVCFEMMRLTNKQLHQGKHSKTDYMEQTEVETDGYNTQAEEFLNEIYQQIVDHIEVEKCEVCKKKNSIEIEPLMSTVKMMEQASFLMKVLTMRNSVAVSRRAGMYIASNSKTGKLIHPGTPYVEESDFL